MTASASASAFDAARPCPGCGDVVHVGDQFCETCGRPRPGVAPPPTTERPPTIERPPAAGRPPEAARCVDCGAAAIEADGYCGRCGLRQPTGREHLEETLTGAGHFLR
ncbi:zinc ribbon domain-containing protein, partial [Spirillospora sp. NPDC049652]